jgi:hypothetical protein
MRSEQCFDCSEIIQSKNLENCYFCNKCLNSKFLMFCNEISDAEYHIFNKPVTKRQFELFARQYKDFMKEELTFVSSWPNETLIEIMPELLVNFSQWYSSIPSKFWKWARTLPNYDPMLLYTITMNPSFLK